MRTLSLTDAQQCRVAVLTRLDAGTPGVGNAAEVLGVSLRQVRRLREQFAREGMAAVVRRNQGRSPVNRTDPATVARIRALVGEGGGKYHDLNVCHL
jgi:hypothetical protein